MMSTLYAYMRRGGIALLLVTFVIGFSPSEVCPQPDDDRYWYGNWTIDNQGGEPKTDFHVSTGVWNQDVGFTGVHFDGVFNNFDWNHPAPLSYFFDWSDGIVNPGDRTHIGLVFSGPDDLEIGVFVFDGYWTPIDLKQVQRPPLLDFCSWTDSILPDSTLSGVYIRNNNVWIDSILIHDLQTMRRPIPVPLDSLMYDQLEGWGSSTGSYILEYGDSLRLEDFPGYGNNYFVQGIAYLPGHKGRTDFVFEYTDGAEDEFLRGDADNSTSLNMSDVYYILKVLYVPDTPPPTCRDALDVNDNGAVSMSDAIYLLKWMYIPGSPPPPPPFDDFPDDCGLDPTEDELDCVWHPCQGGGLPQAKLEVDGEMILGEAVVRDGKVIVPVYLRNNRLLSAFAYTISYDNAALRFKSADNTNLTSENFDFFSARPNEELGSVSVGSVVDLGLKKDFAPGHHEVAHLIFELKADKLEETVLKFSDTELVDAKGHGLSAHTNTCTIRIPFRTLKAFGLKQAFPNPFTGETTIRYQLPKQSHVKLGIYNISGQLVKTLVDTKQSPGYCTTTWNGRDETGMNAASGIYFCRLEAYNDVCTRKITLIR